LELSGIERRKERGEDGLALAEAVVGVARECSRFKPSPEPRKVEGLGSRTKAKGGTGTTIQDILKDIPSGETRARPEILGKKHLVHLDNHGIGVSDPLIHEGPVVVGSGHEKGLERTAFASTKESGGTE
jgi:hypothetical protein